MRDKSLAQLHTLVNNPAGVSWDDASSRLERPVRSVILSAAINLALLNLFARARPPFVHSREEILGCAHIDKA
jgi:hypothetical protein